MKGKKYDISEINIPDFPNNDLFINNFHIQPEFFPLEQNLNIFQEIDYNFYLDNENRENRGQNEGQGINNVSQTLEENFFNYNNEEDCEKKEQSYYNKTQSDQPIAQDIQEISLENVFTIIDNLDKEDNILQKNSPEIILKEKKIICLSENKKEEKKEDTNIEPEYKFNLDFKIEDLNREKQPSFLDNLEEDIKISPKLIQTKKNIEGNSILPIEKKEENNLEQDEIHNIKKSKISNIKQDSINSKQNNHNSSTNGSTANSTSSNYNNKSILNIGKIIFDVVHPLENVIASNMKLNMSSCNLYCKPKKSSQDLEFKLKKKRLREKTIKNKKKSEDLEKPLFRKFKKYLIMNKDKKEFKEIFRKDKEFWKQFLENKKTPHFKYRQNGKEIEFKSFCKDLMEFIFSREDINILYEKFISYERVHLNKKLQNKEKSEYDIHVDLIYLKNFNKKYNPKCKESDLILADDDFP